MEIARGKSQVNVQQDLDKLSLKLRKTGSLPDRDLRPSIQSSYGVGRQQATTAGESDDVGYEAAVVDSTDGLFSFEILTISELI